MTSVVDKALSAVPLALRLSFCISSQYIREFYLTDSFQIASNLI